MLPVLRIIVCGRVCAVLTNRTAYFGTAALSSQISATFTPLPLYLLSKSSFSTTSTATTKKTAEDRIKSILDATFKPTKLVVQDTSGGCGAMFNIEIESTAFSKKNIVAQHRMVNQALAAEIKEMHGLTLKTKAVTVAVPQ